jgi:hypothetical protein
MGLIGQLRAGNQNYTPALTGTALQPVAKKIPAMAGIFSTVVAGRA